MEENTIFEFTDARGNNAIGIVLESNWDDVHARNTYIVYTEHRIVRMSSYNAWVDRKRVEKDFKIDYVIVAYAILPDYDEKLNEIEH